MTALSISTGLDKFQDDRGRKKKDKKHKKTPGAKDRMKMGLGHLHKICHPNRIFYCL